MDINKKSKNKPYKEPKSKVVKQENKSRVIFSDFEKKLIEKVFQKEFNNK